jgi:hypothetical protein
MRKSSYKKSSFRHKTNAITSPEDKMALEQMYQQSLFEAQCWFFISLIVAIIGTMCILGTILLFFLFSNTFVIAKSVKVAMTIGNIATSISQHLIVSQARAANRRVDHYANELRQEANELNVYEIIRIISSSLPEGEERTNLIVHTIADALIHRPHEMPVPQSVPGFLNKRSSSR